MTLLFCSLLRAEEYVLFQKYKSRILPHPRFNDVMKTLTEGDLLTFSNGKTIRLGKRLDHLADDTMKGTRTIIFELADAPDLVIRLPNRYENREGISQTLRGFDELAFLDKNVTKIDDGVEGEFAIVERLPKQTISFQEMILNKLISEKIKSQMVSALARFAKKTANFSDIHDFNVTQLTYSPSKNEWIIFDWGDEHFYYIEDGKIGTDGNIWKFFFHIYIDGDPELYGEIPEFTAEEKEQIREIRDMLIEVTEQERAPLLKKYGLIKPENKCAILLQHFF